LCDLASDFEGRGCAVGIGYGDFGFAGADSGGRTPHYQVALFANTKSIRTLVD
jgi:hypothetical protein